MNRLAFIISTSILLIAPNWVLSQDTWTLETCIQYAVENNLNLKKLDYAKATGQELHKQSYRALLPAISANTNYNIQYGRSIDPNNNDVINVNFFSNSYGVNGNVDLFQGFQRLNTIKSTKFIYKALEQEAEQEKYLLAFRVMQAYYDVQFFDEMLEISYEQVDISQKNSDLVKRQIELGLKAGADLYEANSLLVSDQLLLTQNKNNLKAAELQLIQEMNLKGTVEIQIEKTNDLLSSLKDTTSITSQSVYEKALGFIPIVKARELRVLSAEKDLAVARGTRLPSLSLFGGYGTSFFETNKNAEGAIIPFNEQLKGNAFQFVGVTLNIPISQSGRTHSAIKTNKIALLQAKNDLDIQKQELNNIIQTLIQDYRASLSEFTQTKQQELSRKIAFEIAQKQFEKGLISALDLYTAKNLYAAAQNDNLQIRLMLRLQEKTLTFYQGFPLFNLETINN